MGDIKHDTEKAILKAAKEVFQQKGMAAARMQEIADTAGINKSLLHYYFRTKERLFEAVLQEAILSFYPTVSEVMMSKDISFEKKIETFVNGFHSMLIENPYVPSFLVMELNRDPDKVLSLFGDIITVVRNFVLPSLMEQINKRQAENEIRSIDPRSLIINMISLNAFPFIARPILKGVLFNNSDEAFDQYLKNRNKEVIDFMIDALIIK